MAGMSVYLENKVVDHVTKKATYSAPTNLFVGLYTVAPTDAGGGTEVTGGSYARVSTATADWNTASGGTLTNVNTISFPTASANWGTVVAFGLFDASTAGNMLVWGNLQTSKYTSTGDLLQFLAAGITWKAD